nr:PREDICTED: transmembrane protein 248-like isoform X2 [Lepisosteus oculatus]
MDDLLAQEIWMHLYLSASRSRAEHYAREFTEFTDSCRAPSEPPGVSTPCRRVTVAVPVAMVAWQPFGNLRRCMEDQPPVVIFFLCLLSLAVTFIGFGAYARSHEVKNPDIVQDWNQVLGSLAKLRFCVLENGTDSSTAPLVTGETHASAPLVQHETHDGHVGNPSSDPLALTHLSIVGQLDWAPQRQDQDPVYLSATLWGKQLDFKGSAEKTALNISFILPSWSQLAGNGSERQSGPSRTCIGFSAPARLLPDTPHPQECPTGMDSNSELPSVRAVVSPLSSQEPQNALGCYSTVFTSDPKLTVMLSKHSVKQAEVHSKCFHCFLGLGSDVGGLFDQLPGTSCDSASEQPVFLLC